MKSEYWVTFAQGCKRMATLWAEMYACVEARQMERVGPIWVAIRAEALNLETQLRVIRTGKEDECKPH